MAVENGVIGGGKRCNFGGKSQVSKDSGDEGAAVANTGAKGAPLYGYEIQAFLHDFA